MSDAEGNPPGERAELTEAQAEEDDADDEEVGDRPQGSEDERPAVRRWSQGEEDGEAKGGQGEEREEEEEARETKEEEERDREGKGGQGEGEERDEEETREEEEGEEEEEEEGEEEEEEEGEEEEEVGETKEEEERDREGKGGQGEEEEEKREEEEEVGETQEEEEERGEEEVGETQEEEEERGEEEVGETQEEEEGLEAKSGQREGEQKDMAEEEEEEEEEESEEENEEESEEEAGEIPRKTRVKRHRHRHRAQLEKVTSDSQLAIVGTSWKSHNASKAKKHSLESEDSGPYELRGHSSSQYEYLDLESSSSEEEHKVGEYEMLSSGRLEGPTKQVPQDEEEEGSRAGAEEATPRKEKRRSKRVSYSPYEDVRGHPSQLAASRQSQVYTSTEDALFQKRASLEAHPLTMTWTYGWNSSLPVFYIHEERHRVLLYVCAHTVVIYNTFRNKQYHLQGHPNVISCLCVSEDRRWIATADRGPGCLIIIWDSFTGIPVHTIFDSCPDGNGIRAIAMTRDAKYLATISDAEVQKVCIWKWTLAVETPACTLELPADYGLQNYVTFNPANNKELVSNSKTQVIYYSWDEEKDTLVHSAPVLTEKTFNKLVGKFSQSVFHLHLTQILSATMEGKLVVWDVQRSGGSPYIKPCKLVHLQREGITVLTTVDSYIVTGDIRGNIKFYDRSLSIVNWYSHFKLSSIRTLSFSKTPAAPPTEKSNFPPDCTLKGDLFVVRNFIIGTSDATVYHLTTDGTKLEKLFMEPKDAICAISCHPYQPLIAIGSVCGMIKVWDYEKKKYLFSRAFEKGLGVQSLTHNPEGALLGAGFTEGTVYILDAMSLENESRKPFQYSRGSVTHISFSHDSQYMATADVNCTVAVYMIVVRNGQRVWEYLARLRSHRKSIRSLLFGVHLDSNDPRLLSLGKDRLLIEYNLRRSCRDHLEVVDIHRTDQGDYPTCMVWYPPLTKELFLLICNSGYKVKLFNSTTKMCRKTLLGPTFGSPIEQTQVLPARTAKELQKRYLVFINKDKVGLQILPVDGNPHKTWAIVCHPNGVAGMALSYDGSYAFTAGGHDRSVVQWKINLSTLEAAVSLGGDDLTPFYDLVPGGREGRFYTELEDYFYYSQLRSQGIDTMEDRQVSDHISLSELPYVMRAIGFYPSEEKIANMFNEIKFSEYVNTGKIIDKINLPDFLKVYLNHRPPFGNTMSGIRQTFEVLGFTNSKGQKAIRREDFLKLLQTKGEHMTKEEMLDCFATLFGLNPEGWGSEPAAISFKGSEICLEEELPEEITAEIFTTEILGLAISEDSE